MYASGEIVKWCPLIVALVSLPRAGAGLLDQAPAGWTYKGCFADVARAMNESKTPGDPFRQDDLMTVRMCQEYAFQYSFKYFGLQAGSQCFMSNDLSRATACGRVAQVGQECSTPCSGLPSATCGGGWVNDIYHLAELDGEATIGRVNLGCYHDACGQLRALPFQVSVEPVTPDKCADAAKRLSQSIFGLQTGGQCFVGSDYARAVAGGKLSDEHCQDACTGDTNNYCGGSWANAVYVLQEESPSPSPTAQQQPSPSPAVAQSPSTRNPDEALVTPSGIWSTAQKVGIALGIAAGVCTIAGFVFGMWRHFQKKKKKKAACTSKDSADPAALDVVMR